MGKRSPLSGPRKTAESMARNFFGVGAGPDSTGPASVRWLVGAAWSLVLIPFIFWLGMGEIGALGWGMTAFSCAYCLLSAVGIHFLRRPDYHTPVTPGRNWLDYIGACWLMVCAFGPFFGWVLTSAFPLTEANWRWLYGARAVLSVGLPILTALALLRYVRGKGALLMLALLIGVTSLPVWSAWNICRDLANGPAESKSHSSLVLPYSGETLQKTNHP